MTDTRPAKVPKNSFIMSYQSSRMYPQLEPLARKYSADKKDMANSQNVILTNGEIYFPPDAVKAIGVEKLEFMNNKSKGGAHDAIDNEMAMNLLKNIKPMYGGGMVNPSMKPMGTGGMVDAYRGGGMVMDQYGDGGMVKNKMMNYGHGGMVKNKMMMMQDGGQLKPVPKDNPGLGKLPEMVRNRMGYMQEGGEVIDYLDTAGLYNRFLIENDKMVLPNKDLLIYKSLQNPDLDKKSYSALLDAMSPQGATFAKDASITSRLLSKAGMESTNNSDSLKLVKGLSPEGKRMYESYFLEGGMQDGGMVDNSLMGMMGGGMAMKKKKMMSYQEGGVVDMIKGLLSRMPMKSESVENVEQSGAPMIDMEQVSRRKLGMSFDNYADAIKARNKRLISDYGSLDNAYDLLRSGEITSDILNKERDAFIESGNKIGLLGMQDGGAVMLPPQPMDPLQIGPRQQNPSMYEGSTLGAMRDQAMMLEDSIQQDTVSRARKALQLMRLKGMLGNAEMLDSPTGNPILDREQQMREMQLREMFGNFPE